MFLRFNSFSKPYKQVSKIPFMTEKIIPNLVMHPFNTTLMGVLRGVADFFGINASDAWLFGSSGHAFLINIHEQICPSGPYNWKYGGFYRLVKNLGMEMTDLGFFHAGTPVEERRKVEALLRRSIDTETPCSMLNMENQLITGYGDEHFVLKQPWPTVNLPITPKTLTFETWRELGDEPHARFFTFCKRKSADEKTVVLHSLNAAVDMVKNPENWSVEHYSTGLQAYNLWIKAVNEGFGSSHGNWWNGTVWAECRGMASRYFAEIASKHQDTASETAKELSNQYGNVANLLDKARDKGLADDAKIKMLAEAQRTEESCVTLIEELIRLL